MMNSISRNRALGLAAALAASTCLTSVCHAQSVPATPVFSTIDQFGVDLMRGTFYVSGPAVSIGQPGAGGLSFHRIWDSNAVAWRNDFGGMLNSSNPGSTAVGTQITITLNNVSESFTIQTVNGVNTYVPDQGQGSSLAYNSGSGVYTYTAADGTVAHFSKSLAAAAGVDVANEARITDSTTPAGDALTYTYTPIPQGPPGSRVPWYRLQAVANNHGYQIHLTYDDSVQYAAGQYNLLSVTAINTAVDYCDPTANSCTGLTQSWPTLTYTNAGYTVTDALSRVTTYTNNTTAKTFTVQRPSGATTTYTYSYGYVSSISNGIGTWTYGALANGARVVTDPNSHQKTVTTNSLGQMTASTDAMNYSTYYTYDTQGRLTKVQAPEGNYTQYAYDGRGNITTVTKVAKSGSGLSNIVTTASYDASCTTATYAKCNKPNSTVDERGFETDYTYYVDNSNPNNPVYTGLIASVTLPSATGAAPATTGLRPQVRYTYSQLAAWYKTSSGSTLSQGPAIYTLTSTSACATTSSCSGTSDEIKTTLTYQSGSTSAASNLLPTAISSGSGDGLLTATTSLAYDANFGNLTSVTSPLSGGNQTTSVRYDADREVIGVIGPLPGETGLHRRAKRITYNADGQVTLTERGTVNSLSDADWAAFATLDQTATTYDSIGRPIQSAFSSGGTTYSLTQTSWDTDNRKICTAIRMNPATFSSPPAACTQGTAGSYGPDRITQLAYDVRDNVQTVTTGLGTPAQRNEQNYTYNINGTIGTLADGSGNLTTFIYDGFDRLSKTEYPTPTNGSVSNTSDYEQLTYDAASNAIQDRRRDGALVTFTYDNLNRPVTLTPPTGQYPITLTFDNLSRLLTATTNSKAITYTYDALSRRMSETASPQGTLAFQYDLAGRRTQVTWPDGLYINYDYDLASAVTAIRENGATSGVGVLASYSYDDLGRRTGITRGNGVSTTYGYDNASRLTSLAHTIGGTGNSVTYTLGYNPAGQVVSRTWSNSAYAWSGNTNVDRPYGINGLNQLTTAGSSTFSYDGRENLVSDGTNSYSYDTFNRLTGVNTATLTYDAAGRLVATVAGGTTTQLGYDDDRLVGEYSSAGALLRRYVWGPGADEPAVWYEGSGTTTKRWMVADNLGSVVNTTDATGAPIGSGPNTYDDYGIPGTANLGRFQYTGQAWIPEAGMYHYRARAYSPTLGRFLQPDPIGYIGGTNIYAYAMGDPINEDDPSGLLVCNSYLYGHTTSMGSGNSKVAGLGIDCSRDREVASGGPSNQGPPPADPNKEKTDAERDARERKKDPCDMTYDELTKARDKYDAETLKEALAETLKDLNPFSNQVDLFQFGFLNGDAGELITNIGTDFIKNKGQNWAAAVSGAGKLTALQRILYAAPSAFSYQFIMTSAKRAPGRTAIVQEIYRRISGDHGHSCKRTQ